MHKVHIEITMPFHNTFAILFEPKPNISCHFRYSYYLVQETVPLATIKDRYTNVFLPSRVATKTLPYVRSEKLAKELKNVTNSQIQNVPRIPSSQFSKPPETTEEFNPLTKSSYRFESHAITTINKNQN